MKKNIILWLVICLFLCFKPCTVQAVSTTIAREQIKTSAECSLKMNYTYSNSAFSDLPVQLYRVATVSSDFQFSLTDAFQETGLRMNGVSSNNEWETMRATLGTYITANQINPDFIKITDENGAVSFDELAPGMYFAMPIQFADDDARYTFNSVLAALPGLDESGLWVYDVTAAPKMYVEYLTGENEKYQVTKLWRDSGNTEKRPATVEVDIICNGKVNHTVVLSEDNNWSYSWTAVNNGDVWQVMERNVPDGYIMTVEEHGTSFTVINTIPGTPDAPKTGDTTNISLYVIVMCLCGISLIIAGTFVDRKAGK